MQSNYRIDRRSDCWNSSPWDSSPAADWRWCAPVSRQHSSRCCCCWRAMSRRLAMLRGSWSLSLWWLLWASVGSATMEEDRNMSETCQQRAVNMKIRGNCCSVSLELLLFERDIMYILGCREVRNDGGDDGADLYNCSLTLTIVEGSQNSFFPTSPTLALKRESPHSWGVLSTINNRLSRK